jgi:hypothetical protein
MLWPVCAATPRVENHVPREHASGWLLRHTRRRDMKEKLIMKRCFAPLHDQNVARPFDGGEGGQSMAALLRRIKFDLPLDDLVGQAAPEKSDPATAQPSPVRPLRVKPGKTR